jgi:hypothetical protein
MRYVFRSDTGLSYVNKFLSRKITYCNILVAVAVITINEKMKDNRLVFFIKPGRFSGFHLFFI